MPSTDLIELHSGNSGSCIKYAKLRPAEACSKHYTGSFDIIMRVSKMFGVDICGGLKRNELHEIVFLND